MKSVGESVGARLTSLVIAVARQGVHMRLGMVSVHATTREPAEF
jgi:hypothetical protein